MHDGRILEDKVIKEIEKVEPVKEENLSFKNISFLNQIRLGVRNTFNIFGKFVLLLAVFLFITVAIISEYSSFKKQEYLLATEGHNYVFSDTSLNRIIIKKADKSPITEEDYNNLQNIENVDYVVKNDLLLDESVGLTNNENVYIYGSAKNLKTLSGAVDVGRLPENEYEVVIEGSKDDYYISYMQDEILDKEFTLQYYDVDTGTKLKIVGIKYLENNSFYYSDSKIYMSETVLNILNFRTNQQFSNIRWLFLNKYYSSESYYNQIIPNEKVPQGSAYVSYDLVYYNDGYSIINKPIKIEVENLYYKDELNLKVARTYTKNNLKSLLGLTDYDRYNGSIFINTDDYNNLFNKESYQSSVFVKDVKQVYETNQELENLGYDTIVIKDTLVEEGPTQIIQIMRTVITIILIVTLFFISYFIIKLILKSRNIYFSTVRMLGGTQKISKHLLIIELFTVSNLAYWLYVGAIFIQYKGLINVSYFKDIIEYLKFSDYVILYVVLIAISYLISLRYARKLFEKSSIKTYNEEV